MYRWLRNLHLGVALFFTVVLWVYAVSAVQLAYRLRGTNPTETMTSIDVPAGFQVNPRAFAWWLMDQHGLHGDLTDVKTEGATILLTIVRTGATHRVAYDPRLGSARVTTTAGNAASLLIGFHLASGIAHEYWAINAWGWLLFLTSIALLLLAVTGVVMWFQRHEDRRFGMLVASVGLVWGVTLLILMRVK